MTREVFKNWFLNDFVESVKNFSKKSNVPATALLVVDNAPSHIFYDPLESKDGLIKIVYLLPNTTSVLHLMDQHILYYMKSKYAKKLYYDMYTDNPMDTINTKKINIKEAIFILN
ncbi:hypothetical protein A3Q56_04781, partial [Intoshia linei]